ncbi:MAG: sulfurtransferase [Chloroflexi bacterium]|nr:sulfurtransferase [Chloroflexota bacterium]
MKTEPPLLVSISWLAENQNNAKVRIVDVRWYLAAPQKGYQEYQISHIPGAIFLSLDKDLARPAYQGPGRHPLPTPEEFAAVMGGIGVGSDVHVVAYDSSGGGNAARLWWLLRYYGHALVSLLDGGIGAWQAAGLPLSQDIPHPTSALFVPNPQPHMVVDKEVVRNMIEIHEGLLLDARARERYEGKVEPVDARPGHIPGARNAPYADNVDADGIMRSAPELREHYAALGAQDEEEIVCYCGSGVTAALDVFALTLAGFLNVRLYAGSWSDWSSDPGLPAAIGSAPAPSFK